MISILSTNITSPLGLTTDENYQAVRAGSSAIACHTDKWHLPEPFAASLFTDEQMAALMVDGHTRFESVILHSIREALSHTDLDITSPRLVLILSTTKGNIELLDTPAITTSAPVDTPLAPVGSGSAATNTPAHTPAPVPASAPVQGGSAAIDTPAPAPATHTPAPAPALSYTPDTIYPGMAARRIARTLGITTEPIVVCNACISGVAAQILAQRLLDAGLYDYAIVTGGEVQSKFIVSGFQAFKAVTDEPCRPFDIERLGLNLGDAAATMIMQSNGTTAVQGAIRNDAYHLSAPHPQGNGYALALQAILPDTLDDIATLSVHGTATMYNDQMESKAIQHAGLSTIPLTSLKGYYGHTMGAAGLLETIITLRATDDGIILPARGFEEIGVSGKVNISAEQRTTDKHSIIKMLSGFGGCNGGIRYTAPPPIPAALSPAPSTPSPNESHKSSSPWGRLGGAVASHTVRITPQGAWVDGTQLDTTATGKALLKELYKAHINDYPKFYKMDTLTRLTFVATELLINAEGAPRLADNDTDDSRAIILFNRASSTATDLQYWDTVRNADDYFPSPATFLYTLPNLTTGEVAIRNHYTGETSFYILPDKNQSLIDDIVRVSFLDKATRSAIAGWMDCTDDNTFEADISIITVK